MSSPSGSSRKGPTRPPGSPLREQLDVIPNEPLAADDDERHSTQTVSAVSSDDASGGTQFGFFRGLVWVIVEVLVAGTLLLAPAVVLYWTHPKEASYDLFAVKPPMPNRNAWHEFTRWSVFIAVAYCAYPVLAWLSQAVPCLALKLASRHRGVHKSLGRHLAYLQSISAYTTAAGYFAFLMGWGAALLYQPSALHPAAVVGKVRAFSAWQLYIERGLLIAFIWGSFVAAEKWLIKAISVAFHRSAFMDRVSELNFKLAVLHHLHKWSRSRGGDGTRWARMVPSLRAARRESKDIAAMSELEHSRLMPVADCRAKGLALADTIWQAAAPGQDALTADGLRPAFLETSDGSAANYEDAFAVFFPHGQVGTSILRADFSAAIVDIYEQQHNIQLSLRANSRIVAKLDTVLLLVFLVAASTVTAPVLDVSLDKLLAGLGVLAAMAALLMRNVAQQVFNAFMFVFIEHAFDVGDRVAIGADHYIVKNVEIFSTTFTKWDGTLVVMPNATLATKDIENIRRSACQSDLIDALLPAACTTERLAQLRSAMAAFTLKHPGDFTGFLDIAQMDTVAANAQIRVQFIVQYKGNFQDQAKRNARRALFSGALREEVAKIS